MWGPPCGHASQTAADPGEAAACSPRLPTVTTDGAGNANAAARAALAGLAERGIDWPTRLRFEDMERWRPAAVLALFGVLDDRLALSDDALVARDLDVLLLRRASTLTSHAGQVAFPGGRVDDTDESHIAAALREAEEETG